MKLTAQGPFSRFYKSIEQFLSQGKKRFYVGFSGGPDSTALLSLLLDHPSVQPDQVTACYLNHGVRSTSEMEQETALVEDICHKLGVSLLTGCIQSEEWKRLSLQGKHSDEECARILRYRFFENCMESPDDVFLLAHNRDDQEETVLMRFLQGAFAGLSGIPFSRGPYYRPLLTYSKKQLLEYLENKKIDYSRDSTNSQEFYLRNSLRLRILPRLKEDFPGINTSLINLSNRFRETESLLNMIIESAGWIKVPGRWSLSLDVAEKYPKEFFVRSIFLFYKENIRTWNSSLPSQIPYRFFSPWPEVLENWRFGENSRVLLKGYGFLVGIKDSSLYIELEGETYTSSDFFVRIKEFSGEYSILQNQFTLGISSLKKSSFAEIKKKDSSGIIFHKKSCKLPLIWRSPHTGDSIKTNNGTKKIKKIISEARKKDNEAFFMVLEDKIGPIALYGLVGGEIKIIVSDKINYHFFDDFSDEFYYIRIIRNPKGSLSS